MARSEARHFNGLTHAAFYPYFGERLAPNLGSVASSEIRCRLQRERHDVGTHVEEIFSNGITSSLSFLTRKGGASVRDPNKWFRRICWHETTEYMISLDRRNHRRLDDLMEGIQVLTTPPTLSDEEIYPIINLAIARLRPQHRRLILLDLVACKSPEEIQGILGLESISYFRKVKSEAFSALRVAIKALIEKGIEALF